MGSVGFDVEDESQPSTGNGKKSKLLRTLPDNGGAVNNASVPRKLRSATKKRGRKSVSQHLPISRKQYHVSNAFERLRKDGGKKSKSNMKQGKITKDEEEVAETLFALADMFSDARRAEKSGLNNEPPETKAGSSANAVEDSAIVMPLEESRKIASKFTTNASCNSSGLLNLASKTDEFKSLNNAQQPELPTNKQPAASSASEQTIATEQDRAFKIQYDGNSHPMDDKNNGLLLSLNLSASHALQSETPVSFLRLPESVNSASRTLSNENRVTAEKCAQVESKKSRKRCSAHVYISRMIKDLQEEKERLFKNPTQTSTSGDAGIRSHVRNGCVSLNGTTHFAVENEPPKIQNDMLTSHKRALQHHPSAAETSAPCSSTYQGFDFISSVLSGNEGINRTRHDAPNQFHDPHVQSQSNAAKLFSSSQNGYSAVFNCNQYSSLAPQQAQIPQYPNGTVYGSFSARLEAHSMLNYAQVLFPHLQSALGSKYRQQFSISQQQQQLMPLNSTPLSISNVKRNHHHFPLGFDRNGTAFYKESIP